MSSFNVLARKVRNVDLPLGLRKSALGSCIWSYSRLIHQKYETICERFSDRFGFSSIDRLTEAQLDLVMNALELERKKFLVKLQIFDRQRVNDKLRGRRLPSTAQIEALYHPD
ncbi:hypothetical protein C7B77_18230 [Chamaesiphon polymorphus CCALA 037]|uniref:Uncharacterized protein n=1 Tax=Chamaesiphon polymorphus CCALA 037 TaxID=2107692 RepID=A0A2T1GB35_9CYAN|nr:hypothetical protein C7B77_18230 [Chamaesiphon polymorphus CCALA 037]